MYHLNYVLYTHPRIIHEILGAPYIPIQTNKQLRRLFTMKCKLFLFQNPISGAPQLPREETEAPENNVQCPICLDPFFQPTTTRCGRVFCKNCINCAFRKNKQCPICCKRVTKRDLFSIYLWCTDYVNVILGLAF